MHNDQRNLETIPAGALGMIPLESCREIGEKVDKYLVKWRCVREHEHENDIAFKGYLRDSYIIDASCPRFGRGYDLYIMTDVTNYSLTYKLCGHENHMSPDDHYQDLKRMIAAANGKARRITVIMPFLYESRQHRRTARESMDCALALQELIGMGVDNIITFDAHDPRVQNAIPLHGFDTVQPAYQFVKDMGMFYKRRDYSHIVDGTNPIVAHEFLGSSLDGKDVWVVDDMISSGGSMIDVARELKKRNAGRIFVIATFGLFTNGLEKFDKAVEDGLIYKVVTTNLAYQTPELLSREYYISCDMSKYIAYIIDTLNHDASISDLLDPYQRIQTLVAKYKGEIPAEE